MYPANWASRIHAALATIDPDCDDGYLGMMAAIASLERCPTCDETYRGFDCKFKSGTGDDPGCSDMIKMMLLLRPHCVGVRSLLRVVYRMRRIFGFLMKMDIAIHRSDAITLQQLIAKDSLDKKLMPEELYNKIYTNKCARVGWMKHREEYHNEQATIERGNKWMTDFANSMKVENLDIYKCHVCMRDVMPKQRARPKLNFGSFEDYTNAFNKCSPEKLKLVIHLLENVRKVAIEDLRMCTDCWESLRKGKTPQFSPLNGMDVDDLPAVLAALNNFELMCVQRVRPIMKIISLRTLAQKDFHMNLGALMAKGIQGTVTHLPMPLQPNVSKLLDILPQPQCVEFLLRNIPNESMKHVLQ